MSKVMIWLLVNLEHMSTTITVNNVRLVQNVQHQFRVQSLVLALIIFVPMQAAKEILLVRFVPQDLRCTTTGASDCNAGQYSLEGERNCNNCPDGHFCPS